MGLLESIGRRPVYAGDLKKSFFIRESSDDSERVRIHERNLGPGGVRTRGDSGFHVL
jgi:hypothetical protein